MAYYGVYIPTEKKITNTEDVSSPLVFDDKIEALKFLKKNRESRFKCFKTYEQAEKYANTGLESPNAADVSFELNNKQPETNGSNNNCDKTTPKAAPSVGEKPSSFRAPTPQELVKFRKLIEQHNLESVYKTVWSNPRYLVSSGDTPTILKESFRYNALHVAALAKNAEMCSLILETVGDPKFILLYHGRDDQRTAEEVSKIMLDLYLNTPEKGRGETALHLASKFGAVAVVETLTSYQQCQMNRNVEGMLPADIICTRNEAAGIEVLKAIRTLLEGRFYVPVMRSVDNSLPPVIGEPFAETQLPETNGEDLLSPKMEIRAIAGPMNKEQAETFRKRWKTPPRTLTSSASSLKSPQSNSSPMHGSPLSSYPSSIVRQRCTPNKTPKTPNGDTPRASIEKTSRRLFDTNMNDESTESIVKHLITIPTNLNTAKKSLFRSYREHGEDDSLNESLFGNNVSINDVSVCESPYTVPGFRERNLKLADVDKGLEVIGRGLAKDHNIIWREHWSFLDEFTDIASDDGLRKFEQYLREQSDKKIKPSTMPMPMPKPKVSQKTLAVPTTTTTPCATPISKICNKLTKLNFVRDAHDQTFQARSSTPLSPTAFHAYLCVEQSCQVYAKRFLTRLVDNPSNIVTVNDVLVGELARLKSLICSYKNDGRFIGIDFSATHSRFAHIVIAFLEQTENKETVTIFEQTCKQILQSKEKAFQNAKKNGNIETIRNTAQLVCLLEQFLKRLSMIRNGTRNTNLIYPEILTSETECSDVWQDEYRCDCEWINATETKSNRNIKRKNQRTSDTFTDFCDKINGIRIQDEDDSIEDDDEELVFLSVNNSDEDSDADEYFTPPQSPLQEMFDTSDPRFDYDNFIYGPEPTKMDNDVLKALHNVEIDKNNYPNVFCWHNALLKYSLEERARFPQPQHNSRTLIPQSFAPPPTSTGSQINAIGRTPIRDILPKVCQFQLKPSKLFKD